MKLLSSLLVAAALLAAPGAFAADKHAGHGDHKNCACSDSCPHHDKQASTEKGGHVCTEDCTECAKGGEHQCNDKTCTHEGHGKTKSTKKG